MPTGSIPSVCASSWRASSCRITQSRASESKSTRAVISAKMQRIVHSSRPVAAGKVSRLRFLQVLLVDYPFSLYDALLSVSVPNDKARAVVDSMERDMTTVLATKADLLLVKQDIEHLRTEFGHIRTEIGHV